MTNERHYVFEFDDKVDSSIWLILCFDGTNRYAHKSFNCDEDYRDDAEDYVEEFLKNGGNHYKYSIPWDMCYEINNEDCDGVYVLPDKPLSNLEEYRIYSESYKAEPCEDCVNREAVLKLPKRAMKNYFGEVIGDVVFIEDIKALPPVTPKQKTGYWVKRKTYYECSLCACLAPSVEVLDGIIWKPSNYCPDCGARMERVQE